MTSLTRRSRALPLALTLSGALVCVGLVALPAEASTSASGSATVTAAPAQSPKAKSSKPRASRIPVWVTLGGGSNARGATVKVLDSKGKVVDSATTNASGFAFVNRSKLPSGTFTLKVSGGKTLRAAGVAEMAARESISKNETKTLSISPLTQTAYQVAKSSGSSYSAALSKVKAAVQIPNWATKIQINTNRAFFSGPAFAAWAKSRGGVTGAMRTIGNSAIAGKALPSFARPTVTKATKAKNRSAASTAVWLGGKVLDKVVGGSAGAATSVAIGDILGTSNPSASDVADIASDLDDIVTELGTIEQQQKELIALVSENILDTAATTVNTPLDSAIAQWSNYQALLSEFGTSFFKSDSQAFASDWFTDLNGTIDDYESLMSNGTTGVIEGLYGVYAPDIYSYWTETEVDNLTASIQYYGTWYGNSVALLNEAWWQRGETSSYINTNNNTFTNLSNEVYAELPTQIDSTTIVNPSTQVMYRAQAANVQEVWENTSRGNNENPSCNSKGSVMSATSWPYVQPSNTNWANLWQGKVTDSSWTVSPSSDFAWLQKSRKVNNETQWTLPTLIAGAPTGWVLVGSDTQPIGGFANTTVESVSFDTFANFMWCYSTSASLVKSTPSSWTFNVATDTSGNATYPGTAAKEYVAAPVGILVHKSGKFQY
jgi:hypothetical protein